METTYNGALPDFRTEEMKAKDYQHEELFGQAAPVEWVEKEFEPYLPIRNQDGSGSCGGFAGNIALGINEKNDNGTFIPLSPAYIYNNRANKNSAGMHVIDLAEILTKKGSFPDPNLTSDNLNEAQINSMRFTTEQVLEALKYKGLNYLFVAKNIDAVADVIAKGYAPIFLLRCEGDEYTEDPQVLHPEKRIGSYFGWAINHFITGVDYGLRKGKKVIPSQESWGVGALPKALRYFTDDFIKNRVELIFYVIDLPTEEGTVKPKFHFERNKALKFGQKSPEVKKLQEMMAYEGLFPKDHCTGYFGAITAASLRKWQMKHGIMDFANETDVRKIQFYNKSIDEANKTYN